MGIFKVKAPTFQTSEEFFNIQAVLRFLKKSFWITIADEEHVFATAEFHYRQINRVIIDFTVN